MSSFLQKISKLLPKKEIYRSDKGVYLTRHYLIPHNRPKWIPGIYLHCIHASDEDAELHDHPWKSAFSLILSGSYKEEVRTDYDQVMFRVLNPGDFNIIKGTRFHRLDIINGEVWTFFVSFSRHKDWGFWNRSTKVYTQWEEFEKLKSDKKAA